MFINSQYLVAWHQQVGRSAIISHFSDEDALEVSSITDYSMLTGVRIQH